MPAARDVRVGITALLGPALLPCVRLAATVSGDRRSALSLNGDTTCLHREAVSKRCAMLATIAQVERYPVARAVQAMNVWQAPPSPALNPVVSADTVHIPPYSLFVRQELTE